MNEDENAFLDFYVDDPSHGHGSSDRGLSRRDPLLTPTRDNERRQRSSPVGSLHEISRSTRGSRFWRTMRCTRLGGTSQTR